MTVIDRPWLFRDDDGRPRFRASWHEESRADGSKRWHGPVARQAFEPHDRQTLALIQRLDELGRFRHGEAVAPLLEEWKWRDSMHGPAEKQRFLEPMIQRTKRDPDANEGVLIFLLLVCEGVRRGVARELLAARTGLEGPSAAPAFHRREEARRIRDIERERLFDVTRMATLEALYRYPSPPPPHFFGWLRETIAHRTLDFLRSELSELRTSSLVGEDAEAMQAFLSGIEAAVPPALADDRGLARWRRRIGVRPLYEAVGEFWRLDGVRAACRTAVGRLPCGQRSVIEAHFYDDKPPEEIARERGVSRSTVYNTKAQALVALRSDDCFFAALCGLRVVRDKLRERELHARYPQGLLPDGRRIIWIDQAA